MKLSIFTTITDPVKRGDNLIDAINCYQALADELIIVDGNRKSDGLETKSQSYIFDNSENDRLASQFGFLRNPWPKEFKWPFIGQQFQAGYEACTGDWCIRMDLDMLFHENNFVAIRQACIDNADQPVFSMLKHQFVLPDRFNLKSRLVIAVNKKKFGDRIKFDSGGDLCQVSLDGKYLEPGSVPDVKIPIWNYEKLTKTREQIMDDVGRMERAYKRHFGHTQYGSDGTNKDAFAKWCEAQKGKFNKPHERIKLEEHPRFIKETIKNLKPHQWGYSGFSNLEMNSYVKNA